MSALSILAVLGPDDALNVAALVLVVVAARAIYVRVRRPAKAPPSRRRGPATPKQRCRGHQDKVMFATERDARTFVTWTQERHRAGRWSGKPMDHHYRCPVGNHWHVSSKPRRPS